MHSSVSSPGALRIIWSGSESDAMKYVLLTMLLIAALPAQETRREETLRSTNPADDTRGLNAQVPDVYAIPAQMQRVVVLRFKFDTDLLAGLEKMVKQEKIKNAVILSAF